MMVTAQVILDRLAPAAGRMEKEAMFAPAREAMS
jgi:hypothetical protein